jgi:glutaminyl-tRNA synthetase
MIQQVLENSLSRELYIEREDFLEVAPAKFFRLSIGNEVRLKMRISSKAESVVKTEGLLLKSMFYDEDSRSGRGVKLRKKSSGYITLGVYKTCC